MDDEQLRIFRRRVARVVPFALLAVALSWYALRTRSDSNFLLATRVLSACAVICTHWLLAWRAGLRSPAALVSATFSGGVLGYHALGPALYGAYACTYDLMHLLIRSTPAVRALAVFLLGAALFLWRRYFQSVYGAAEVIIGIVIGAQKISDANGLSITSHPELAIAFLTAALYLVVRGLDNIEQGFRKQPGDQFVAHCRLLLERLRTKTVAYVEQKLELSTDEDEL